METLQINKENAVKASELKARKGKSKQYGIKVFDRNAEKYIVELQKILFEKRYKTSEYTTFKVFEPKESLVFRLIIIIQAQNHF